MATTKLTNKEKHLLMQEELKEAQKKLQDLLEQKEALEERIEHWKKQVGAIHTLDGRYAVAAMKDGGV